MSDDRARSVSLIVHECTNNTIEKERRVGNRNFWRLCLITSWTRVLMVSWLTSSSFFLNRNVSLLLEWLYWMLDSFGLFLLRPGITGPFRRIFGKYSASINLHSCIVGPIGAKKNSMSEYLGRISPIFSPKKLAGKYFLDQSKSFPSH